MIEVDYADIASRFDIAAPAIEIKPLGNGLINDTFAVTDSAGDGFVLQRINTAVFPDVDALQENLSKITRHIRRCLEEKGVKDIDRRVLTPVQAADGTAYVRARGEVWRMTRLIPDSVTYEKVTPEMAELTGRAFADFHAVLARPDAPRLQETIKDFHNVAFRIRQLRDAMAEDKAGRLAEVRDLCDYLLSRDDEMTLAQRLEAEGKLPRRIAHCDTKLNNILFDPSGEILCVIDLDTTMPGFVLSDFGDFIRTAASTAAEDDPDTSKVKVDMQIFRSFARGYIGAATFLTPLERDLLPYGAQMLTYMQAVRFLTDYLNGDTYYKTNYPEHNLVRTRNQLALLHDIDMHVPHMRSIIIELSTQ